MLGAIELDVPGAAVDFVFGWLTAPALRKWLASVHRLPVARKIADVFEPLLAF